MVSTQLARALTLAIGTRLFKTALERAEALWKLRCKKPETFAPVPAARQRRDRHERVDVMPYDTVIVDASVFCRSGGLREQPLGFPAQYA